MKFEQYLFTSMRKGELYFPKGVIHTGSAVTEPIPQEASWLKRFAALAGAWRFVQQPAIAYLIVAVLAYPAYLGVFREPAIITQVVTEKRPVEVPKIGDLVSTPREVSLRRSGIRGEGRETVASFSDDDQFVVLSFFVPITTEPHVRYDVLILDATGTMVAEKKAIVSRDELGNFSLVCRRELFSDGRYLLRVLKVHRTTSMLERQYDFKFKVVPAGTAKGDEGRGPS